MDDYSSGHIKNHIKNKNVKYIRGHTKDIYKVLINAGEDIGLATVYRVLTQFETAGLVTRHSFEGGHSLFELDYGENHDHMVNIDTGEAVCFKSKELQDVQDAIADEHGFEVLDHSLVLYVKAKK